MKKYTVDVKVECYTTVEVEAENEEEAKAFAYDDVKDERIQMLDYYVYPEIKDEQYAWNADDIKKFQSVLSGLPAVDEKEINEAIDDSIVFWALDREDAYFEFEGNNDFDELRANGIDPTFEWFCSELDKGYHGSGSIEIARLIETSNGIFYDKEYV